MKLRPRLTRPFSFFLVAIAGLLALSYFPLARIRAAGAAATILPSAGKPLVNLKNPQNMKVTYTGSSAAVAALQAGTANPTALAAADFDADGAMDVVAGYSIKNGGVIALYKGNPDAFAPTDTSLYARAMKGNVPPTFLSKAKVFAVPGSPDLIVTGDFNRDGYKDVLIASRGGSLYFLAGDGKGNLGAPQPVALADQVIALAANVDGHVAVSTDGRSGPQITILSPSAVGLSTGQSFSLPARGDSLAWGTLGGGADLAVGAGSSVVMIYGALTANAQTETVNLPFSVRALALGDYIWDRDGRTEIAALADDGSIHILQHGTLDTTPLTAAELPARRAAIRGHHARPTAPPNPTALGAWTVAKQLPYTGSTPSGPVSPSAFNSPRLAAASTHDLMVLDAGRSQLNILDTSGKAASPSAGISFSGTPVAALALPQKINAGRDIVVLTSGQPAPMLIPSGGDPTFTVTTTADEDPDHACTTPSVTTASGALSLREAVCLANNNAPNPSTINIGSGTYQLTSFETGELQVGGSSGYSLTITGTGTPQNTIIQQTDNVDRIFEEDITLQGGNPLTIQNVTLTGGLCTNEGDCGFGGGAILAGGFTGDDLTLTNVVLNYNQANPTGTGAAGQANGGAIDFEIPGNLTITNSTFSSNTASAAGGAIEFVEGPTAPGSLSVTNSTFSSNTTVISGGGIYATLQGSGTETPATVTISGSTFTRNSVTEGAGTGGGIYAETLGTVTVSNSRFVGNSAPNGGTGASINASTAGTLTDNWWGCNAGPGNTGCDSVFAGGGGTATFNPWLVLSISASSTQIDPSGTSNLTADLTHNSNGIGGFSVPDGTPVTFGETLGSVNPTSTTTTSGEATSVYTAGNTPGTGTGTAKVDNQTVSVNIDIGAPPGITSASGTTFTFGTAGTFTVTTTGSPTPSLSENGSLPGGVGFHDNGDGTATISGTPGSTGSFPITITATNGFSPNATQDFTLMVNKVSTTTSVQVDDAHSDSPWSGTEVTGASAYASSTVSSASGGGPSPTGNVTYTLYGTGSCSSRVFTSTVTLVSGSVPNSSTSPPLSRGTYSFQASYSGDSNYNPSSNNCASFRVSAAPTSIAVTNVNPSSEGYGQDAQVTITAVLSGVVPGFPPAGPVTISGNGPSGTYGTTSCGHGNTITCTNTYSSTAADFVGTYTETASYSGDSNYLSSSSIQTNNFSITQATSSTSVGSGQNPSLVGQQVTFTATIDGEYGLVVKKNGVSISGSVGKRGQRVSIQKGQAHPLTVGGITGTVTWSANTGCGTTSVSGDPGTSQCTTTSLQQGTDTITATYSGDTNHSGSTGTLSDGQVVNAAMTSTSINVTSVSPSSEAYGLDSSFTITAVLTWTGTGPAPTASDVTIGGTGPSGYSATSCGTPSSDTLTCTATYTPTGADTVGTYTESASFSDDSNYTGSSSPQTNNFSITQATSGTSVGSNANPSLVGQQVTFTATIDGEYGLVVKRNENGVVPGGSVSVIKRGQRALAQRALTQKVHPLVPTGGITGTVTWSVNTGCGTTSVSGNPGTSQCMTSTLPHGTDTITATYSGDTNHSGSGGTLAGGQVVNPAASGTLTYPPTLDFGTVYLNSKQKLTATIKNTGTANVTFTGDSITLGTADAAAYKPILYCTGTPLKPGKSCTVAVDLVADAVGTLTATLNIMDNASPHPQQISLTANVIDPVAQFSPTKLAFGSVPVNGSKTLPVQLTNIGQTALDINNVTIAGTNSAGFSPNNLCPASLAPTDSCTIEVTFAPKTKGAVGGMLMVTDNVTAGKSSMPISGTGH